MKKIIIICPYPPETVPSQRFRYEQYLNKLKTYHTVNTAPFFSLPDYFIIYQKGNFFTKIVAILISYLRRFAILLHLNKYDLVFIHREATPVGPPLIEWIISRVFKKKIIYDFDDAIWLTDNSQESFFTRFMRWRSKTGLICKWSYRVSCGNKYLAQFASKFNSNVVINPTTIDTEHHHNRSFYEKPEKRYITIGWTGSRSTLKYLKEIEPVITELQKSFPALSLLIIADEKPDLQVRNVLFRKWSKETEVSDLMIADIGIMPLPDDEWTKGKCGFKALQYMALEIPAVVSAVGVNYSIIDHGHNGYLCTSPAEWLTCLTQLISDARLRKIMGSKGRLKVEQYYSVSSNSSNFLSLFQ